MASSKDTEITLGTGKVLFLFFGLVALCGAFFGLGFKMGKGSAPAVVMADSGSTSVAAGGTRPSAVKASGAAASAASPDVALYRTASQKSAATPPAATTTDNPDTTGPDPAAAPPVNGYYVQVAAVSREEDGEALVDALKKKQYPASASVGIDKLYHIQVGPFADIKKAEETRARLMNDGYNPILKK